MATVKGRITRPATLGGFSRVQFRYPGTNIPAAIFYLEGSDISGRSFRIKARTVTRVAERTESLFRTLVQVISSITFLADGGIVIAGRLIRNHDAQVVIAHPLRRHFDTSVHCYGEFTKEMAVSIIIGWKAAVSSAARQTVYNVLINEEHPILV